MDGLWTLSGFEVFAALGAGVFIVGGGLILLALLQPPRGIDAATPEPDTAPLAAHGVSPPSAPCPQSWRTADEAYRDILWLVPDDDWALAGLARLASANRAGAV
jgi:hypothetical protein